MAHITWAMIDGVFSSKSMFAPNLSNSLQSCAQVMFRVFKLFQGKRVLFSDLGPEL